MKWKLPQEGDERIRYGFLWLPMFAWGGEYRWLERATWLERHNGYDWQTVRWID